MLWGPHWYPKIHMVGCSVGVIGSRGVVLSGTGPIGCENRPSRGVFRYDAVPWACGPPTHYSGISVPALPDFKPTRTGGRVCTSCAFWSDSRLSMS